MDEERGRPTSSPGVPGLPPAQRAIDAASLTRLEPLILEELSRITAAGSSSRRESLRIGAAVTQVFVRLFGTDRSAQERALFLNFAAPHMRRILLRKATSVTPQTRFSGFDATEVERWLLELETVAPLQARMIDLHYFSGLSEQETATVLGLPLRTVMRDIRFVRAWLSSTKKKLTG